MHGKKAVHRIFFARLAAHIPNSLEKSKKWKFLFPYNEIRNEADGLFVWKRRLII